MLRLFLHSVLLFELIVCVPGQNVTRNGITPAVLIHRPEMKLLAEGSIPSMQRLSEQVFRLKKPLEHRPQFD
jgi:hypothetical protein